jgi:hypothetical protein
MILVAAIRLMSFCRLQTRPRKNLHAIDLSRSLLAAGSKSLMRPTGRQHSCALDLRGVFGAVQKIPLAPLAGAVEHES